jgi:hypothetical protein
MPHSAEDSPEKDYRRAHFTHEVCRYVRVENLPGVDADTAALPAAFTAEAAEYTAGGVGVG